MKRLFILALLAALFLSPAPAVAKKKFTVGVSIWTGWMPFYYMEEKGILARRAAEEGIEIELLKFKEYLASVQNFAAGKSDACAMTIMDAMQPAAAGIDSVAVLPNDFSNGGDGIVAKKGLKLADIKGKEVLLEQYSVSHYLLLRALEKNGMTEGQVIIKNTPGDDAGKAFLTGNCDFAATWNPHLFLAEEQGKGDIIFSSKEIPREIVDLLVWNGKLLKEDPRAARAIVKAWFDVAKLLTDPKTHDDTVASMAAEAAASKEQFAKMLGGTDIFTSPEKAAEFLTSDTIKATEKSVKSFLVKHDQLKDDSVSLTYDASYIPRK